MWPSVCGPSTCWYRGSQKLSRLRPSGIDELSKDVGEEIIIHPVNRNYTEETFFKLLIQQASNFLPRVTLQD